MRLFSSYTSALTRSTPAASPPADHDFWYTKIQRLFGFGECSVRADPDNALGLPAVYACVRVLAFTAASLPLIAYERVGEHDRRRAQGVYFQRLILRPNRWQYHFRWMVMMFGHLALRGNCYSQIVRNRRGEVAQLIPMHPARVTVEQTARGYLRYILDADDRSKRQEFDQEEVFHCTALTTDGLVGLCPITVARRMFEERMASKEYRARFYENSAQPAGILKMPGALKDEDAVKRLKKTWAEAHSGVRNAHKVAILEDGLEWQQVGLSSKDNDFVNEERLGLEDIARMYGIPPHKIGDLSRSTNNNIEHQSIEFVRDCLTPWLKNFEEALMFALLTPDEAERYYFEFLVDGLLRGDYKTRQEGLAFQRQNGIITANEWRRLENMNALPPEEGDKLLVNGNMVPVKDAGAHLQQQDPEADPDADPDDEEDDERSDLSPLKQSHAEVFREIIARLERKFEKWEEFNHTKPNYSENRAVFVQNHRTFMIESLLSAAKNYRISLVFAQKRAISESSEAVTKRIAAELEAFCDYVFRNDQPEPLEPRVERYSGALMKLIESTLEEA